MEVLYRSCSGIDIHTKTAVVCLLKDGVKLTRTYSTMTADLLEMLDWLESEDCTHVAIESTGVYWRPVFNLLEGHLEVIWLMPDMSKPFRAERPMSKTVNGWLNCFATDC